MVYNNPYTIKSYKNYLQNMQHMVLRNRPTLIIGTERLACLNSPLACSGGPSPSTRQVPGSSPGPGGCAARAFFLHPPFLPPSGDSFFRTFPTNPAKVLGLIFQKYTKINHLYCHFPHLKVPVKSATCLECTIQNRGVRCACSYAWAHNNKYL